jgi:uncharacterized membrane protein
MDGRQILQEGMMINFLTTATTVFIGLLIGVEFAVSAFVNPVLWTLEPSAQAAAIGMFARRLGRAMPPWYITSFLLLILAAIVRRHQAGEILLIAAIGIWASVILLTILFLVPINNRMARLTAETISNEELRDHRKWDALHRLRVVALRGAMVCFLLASYH